MAEPVAERLRAQLLTGPPAREPVAVAERLLAVQAQDPRGARLAIRARTAGVTAADVDRCLTDERSLLITTLNRGTLHLVRSQDYPWLQALTTPPLASGNARRLAQEGVPPDDAERAVAIVERALADDGPLTRAELRERIAAAGIETAGQAFVHIAMLASLRGLVVRGPMAGRQHAFVLVRDWLGEQPAVDRDAALAELARRYLAGHGPADERDLARWAGLPLRDARAGLTAIAGELAERDDGLVALAKPRAEAARGEASGTARGGASGTGRGGALRGTRATATRAARGPAPSATRGPTPSAARAAGDETPPPRLLGAFEPLLLGWHSREAWLGARGEPAVVSGGMFRPFAMVRGRAVATWRLRAGAVEIEPFARIARADRDLLDQDARAVVRYLGPAR
ncbi:MAG: winged helix DNA-binding domain-containing protein [Thermoleophilaceae bacterium]